MTNTNIKTRQVSVLLAAEGGVPQEIQLIKPGSWDTVAYGHIEITEADLDQAVQNFNEGVRKGVPINFDHEKTEAAAWITKIENKGDGQGIWATALEWTAKGLEAVKDGVYKFISPEYDFVHLDMATGDLIPNVLIGAALTNYPLFKDLQAIKASENETNIIYVPMAKKLEADDMNNVDQGSNAGDEATESLEEKIDEIQDAFWCWDMNPFTGMAGYVVETHEGYLIVCSDSDWDGYYQTYQVNFTQTADAITFEAPFEVKAQYVRMEAAEKDAKRQDKVHVQAAIAKFQATEFESEEAKADALAKLTVAANRYKMDVSNLEAKEINKNKMSKELDDKKLEVAEVKETVSLSASELENLKLEAAEGKAAMLKIRRMEAKEKTEGWLFNEKDGGKFPTTAHDALTDFYLSLSDKQIEAFEGIVEAMPAAKALFSENAEQGEDGGEKADADELVTKADQIIADEKAAGRTIGFGEAIKRAGAKNPELAKAHAPKVSKN